MNTENSVGPDVVPVCAVDPDPCIPDVMDQMITGGSNASTSSD